MPRVLIIHAEDGQVLADRVMNLIREKLPKDVRIDTTRELPDRAESLLVLFVLSPGSIRDQQALEFAEDAARREFPVVPIVEDITTYSFALIPANAKLLGSRNAIGLAPNEERFLETVPRPPRVGVVRPAPTGFHLLPADRCRGGRPGHRAVPLDPPVRPLPRHHPA